MTRIIYNNDTMKVMSLFEELTNAKLRDCIAYSDRFVFIVEENQIGKAIGKSGANVKKLESMLNKKIRIVEFSSDVIQFVKNFIYPLQAKEINKENKLITIAGSDTKTKGMLIGRDSRNIKNLRSIVKRYFDIDEIKVI